MLDRIIFGDNQFFGINHMSEGKAQAQSEKFSNIKSITDVIDIAYESGINAFMLNTHTRAKEICDYWRENASRFSNLSLYPSVPYAHKYADLVAEKGIFGAIKDTIFSGSGVVDIAKLVTRGGFSLIEKDMIEVMKLLVDIEMKMFHDLNIKVLFLQNIVTDLLLGFGVKDPFIAFSEHVRNRYGAEAGFVSLNMPKLVNFLLECGIENPIVCSSVNKAGYFMNPSITSYEETIQDKPFRPIAMSVLASGAIAPKEAVEYVCNMHQVESIVFGASSKKHITETKEIIDNCWRAK